MIQFQYFTSGLKNNHINKILNNYRIKYTHVKNEIEAKINNMIKLFLNDILIFLENIEEVAQEKRKISDYEIIKNELELSRIKIKNNIFNEQKLKNECDVLQQENCLLKLKINSLNQKIYVLSNTNNWNNQKISPLRKTNEQYLNRNNYNFSYNNYVSKSNCMSPKELSPRSQFSSVLEENSNKSIVSLLSPGRNELNISNKSQYLDKLSLKLTYDKMVKKRNQFNKNKKATKIYKAKVNKINKNSSLKKFNNKKEEDNSTKIKPIINIMKNKNKKINLSTDNQIINNRYSPMYSINQTIESQINMTSIDFEDLGKKINNIIDLEIKELEQDESNIELLLNSLNAFNNKNKNI